MKPDTTLDELGLTSLDRIELMMALEDQARVTLSETAVERSAHRRRPSPFDRAGGWRGAAPEPFSFPVWNRWPVDPSCEERQPTDVDSAACHVFFRLRVEGREHLDGLAGPLIFASNHQSHFDTPVLLTALPVGGDEQSPSRWGRNISMRISSPTPHSQGTTDDERHLLSRHLLLQCVPPATEGAWSQADAALHGRARGGWLFDLDLSGRPPHGAR